jgi:hypothetical protein
VQGYALCLGSGGFGRFFSSLVQEGANHLFLLFGYNNHIWTRELLCNKHMTLLNKDLLLSAKKIVKLAKRLALAGKVFVKAI